MVKIQKPIPKKLGNKPKLDNPIKQKKQQLKKEKSSTTAVKNTKAKLLDDSTPVKEAKVSLKPAKEVIEKKQNKKELNGEKKSAKKPLILAPESPKPKEKKNKKNNADKAKNVVKNGTEKIAKHIEVPEKVAKKSAPLPEPIISVKPPKKSKVIKGEKDVPASPILVPLVKAIPTKAEDLAPPKVSKKKKKESNASKDEPVAPVLAKQPKAIAQKKTESLAPKGEPATPVSAKPGKKQKNKKAAIVAAVPTPAIEKIKKVKKPKLQLQDKKKAKIAFRKAQLAAKGQPKKEKKQNHGFRYDPVPYDEEKFNSIVNKENIKQIAEALKNTVQKEVSTKKSTIFDDYRYFLQVASFKIPNCPKRMVKLNLKHSLVDKDDDVLLVVPDLQRGAKVDYEPTKHHYEDMLRYHGVEGITVMPMNQLRKEYSTYEQKRRLCASYEYYMCDGRIVSHVGAIVGKLTQKPRNTFHAVRLNEDKDIKSEIEKSLKKTAYRQVAKSSLHTIPVGTHKFTTEQLVANIEFVLDQLKKIFPGGLGNVRNLHLRIGLTGTSSLPLYISMAQAPEKTPMVIGPREERMIKLKREANEVLTKFAMTKEGKLIKLTKAGVEKKRKMQELKTALKEDEEESAKKAKKAKKTSDKEGKKEKKGKEVKELELPENDEEDDDDDSSDEDDEDAAQLGSGSDDETEDDEMANLDEDTESVAEIVENGFVGEDDEESEEDDEVNPGENDDDDEEEDDDDDDEDESEDSD